MSEETKKTETAEEEQTAPAEEIKEDKKEEKPGKKAEKEIESLKAQLKRRRKSI